jgi:tetratricopeptide (TPR) repeat protein
MEREMKFSAAIVVVLAACWGVFELCVRPARCNYLEGQAERTTLMAYEGRRPEFITRRIAQSTLSQIGSCLQCCPNANLLMIAAACHRLEGRNDFAIRDYRTALIYDRRPEIYYNLGMTQVDAGQTEEAVNNLTLAVKFNQLMLSSVLPFEIMDRVQHRVSEWEGYAKIRAAKRQ